MTRLPTHDGRTVEIGGARGAPLLVAFLPHAFTDEARATLLALPGGVDTVVVGADQPPVLAAFAAEARATATLASDPSGIVREAVEGVEGGAVLLDAAGRVLRRWDHVPGRHTVDPLVAAAPPAGPDRRLVAALVLVSLFAVVDALGFWTYTTDDAYITLRYAWHFLQGDGLVFNPGERVEGFSNPTWLFVLTVPLALGVDPMAFGKGLGAVLQGATVAFAGLAAWRLADARSLAARATALLAATLTACTLPLAWWAAGNLETPLYACLLAAALWRILAERPDALPVSAILVGFAGFSRPEAPLVAASLFGVRFLVLGRDLGRFRRWALVAATPMAAWFAFRVVYYGDLVPNTYYHKGGQASWKEIVDYYGPFLRNEWPFVVALVAGAVGLGVRRRTAAIWVGVAALAHLVFLGVVGGDWMANQRFVAPALPLFAAIAGAGFAALVDRPPGLVPALAVAGLAALLGGAHAFRALTVRIAETDNDGAFATTPRDAGDWPTRSFRNGFGGSNNVVVGWLLQNVAPGATVAYSEVGLVAYAGGWIVQDLVGLTDRDLGGATGLDVEQRVEVVHQRHPDWIVLREGGTQNIRAVRAAAWLREEYDIQAGPKQLLVARRKGVAGATPAQALENLERAVSLAPGFPGFHDARIPLAMAIGTDAQKAAACDDLEAALPYGQDRIRRCRAALAGRAPYETRATPKAGTAATEGADPANPGNDPAELPADAPAPGAAPKTGPRKQGAVGLGWQAIPKTLANAEVRVEGDTLVVASTGGTPVATACQEATVAVSGTVTAKWEWKYQGVEPDGKKGARMTARMLDVTGAVLPGGYTPTGGMQLLQNARGSHDWEAVEHEATAPPGAVSVRVCLDVPAKAGTVWVRNLVVQD